MFVLTLGYINNVNHSYKQSYCSCGVQCEISLILKQSQSEQIHIFYYVFITVII